MIDIIKNYNIDISLLDRDYFTQPLYISKNGVGSEMPSKKDIEYLYNTLNIPKSIMIKLFKTTESTFSRWLRIYGIKKDISNRIANTEKSNTIKYGCKNVFQLKEVKDKITTSNNIKYNRNSANQTNITEEGYLALCDKERLNTYIIDNNITSTTELSQRFNIGLSALDRYIKKYNLYHLFDYQKSSYENELLEFIGTTTFELNTKKYLPNREIDIFIPNKNIGIEFNGNYWHSEKIKDKRYHQQKSLLAEDKGIFLYHIFEYEWLNKKEHIINQLNNLLGINEYKIYARKCIIKEVNNTNKKKFLELNHMQGNDNSSIKLGLYYDNELVSIMTFCKPRFNKKYQWELSRFCSKANTNVIGGASKLFKYFVNNYNPTSIISYSNIAHTRGNLYKTLGMTLQGISEPNYVWCKGFKILSRYQCQKHKLIEQDYQGKSEVDIMHNRGYYRIYDCGNKVWVWNK